MSEQTETVSSRTPEPRARIRVGFKPTASRGWEYDSTAEVEFDPAKPGAYGEAIALLAKLTTDGRALGEFERDARNRRDRGEAAK